MGLFTDGNISTIEDLRRYETSILDVARMEGIDLTNKLTLAEEEVAIALNLFLQGRTGPDLSSVVVTAPLQKWHTFQTLSLTFRDSYSNQLNDRYQGKWREYEKLTKSAASALLHTGVGFACDPIAKARIPEMGVLPGAAVAATYYVRVTWVNTRQEEGSPSDLAVFSVADGQVLTVKTVSPPANATGWNVYAGLSELDQALQNQQPLAKDQLWMEPGSGLKAGRAPGTGQAPQFYVRIRGTIQRG